MTKASASRKNVLISMVSAVIVFMVGCAYQQPPPPVPVPQSMSTSALDWSQLPTPPLKKDLVAIAGFENKSTYSADRLWDTSSRLLASRLLRAQYFRVVEWEKTHYCCHLVGYFAFVCVDNDNYHCWNIGQIMK